MKVIKDFTVGPRVIALLFTAAFVLHAADRDSADLKKPDSIYTLDKTVVTASRTARLLSETPASATVIDKELIRAAPVKTIEDVLQSQTGVQVNRPVAIGEGIPSNIVIRGIPGAMAAARTLILVDGIPTNVSGTPLLIVNAIPMESIDRIEIVRGPYSSLYGANAFGGVINIITQEGSGKAKGSFAAETSYPFSVLNEYFGNNTSAANAFRKADTEAYYNVNGTVSGGTEKFGVLASTGYRTIGNYFLNDSGIARNGTRWRNISSANRDYSEYRFFGKARYYCTDNTDVSLHVRYFTSELGAGQTKLLKPDSMDIVTKGNVLLIGPQAKFNLGDGNSIRAGAFYRIVTGEFWNEGIDRINAKDTAVQSYWKSSTADWQMEAQGTFALGENNVITTGAEYLHDGADFGATINPSTQQIFQHSSSMNTSIVNGGGFIQDELKLFDNRLNVVPGARLDYQSEFGAVFCPKLGVSYKIIDQLRFRTSAGRSYRAPSLAELYLPDLQAIAGYWVKANPNLKPEYIWGFDAGFDITPLKSLVVKVGPFYNKMTGLIGEVPGSDSLRLIYITHRNISAAWTEGIEGEVEWRPLQWVLLSTHCTLQNSRDETTNGQLNEIPKVLLGFGADASRRIKAVKLDGQLRFNYVGGRQFLDLAHSTYVNNPDGTTSFGIPTPAISSYKTVDLALTCTVKHYRFTLGAQNIFNAKFEESAGNESPGRFATIKVGYDF
jgi:outer membrane receptor for ferrienterochelin and colicins